MFGLRKKNVVGIDIDTFAVRLVQLQRDDTGYTVTGACETEIAPSGNNPDLHRIHTVDAIREGLYESDIEGKLAVCGLRGPEIVVRGFEFPALPDEEIAGAVGLEVSQICPFGAEESTLDYQVTSINAGKTEGFWVAANNSLIRSTRQLMHEAGLRCAMLDVAGLALLNCLASSQKAGQRAQDAMARCSRTAVLDIGGSCSTVAIVDQANRPFVRDIGIGSDEILNRMATRTGTPFEVVRATLLNRVPDWQTADDPESDTPDAGRIWDNLEEACNELVEAVATTLRYYAAQHGAVAAAQGLASGGGSARAERLLVCGTFAEIPAFLELLRASLYLDVATWNPLESMRNDAGQSRDLASLLQEAGSSMALAAGLAMRHI